MVMLAHIPGILSAFERHFDMVMLTNVPGILSAFERHFGMVMLTNIPGILSALERHFDMVILSNRRNLPHFRQFVAPAESQITQIRFLVFVLRTVKHNSKCCQVVREF